MISAKTNGASKSGPIGGNVAHGVLDGMVVAIAGAVIGIVLRSSLQLFLLLRIRYFLAKFELVRLAGTLILHPDSL